MEIEKKLQCQNQSKQEGPQQNPCPREGNVKKAYEDIKNKIIEAEKEKIKTVMGSQHSKAMEIEKKVQCQNRSKTEGTRTESISLGMKCKKGL